MTEETIFRIMTVLTVFQLWAMIYVLKKIIEIEVKIHKPKDEE